MSLGIEVGGTNTDTVVLDTRRVVSIGKVPTTPDVTSGIIHSVQGALAGVELGTC